MKLILAFGFAVTGTLFAGLPPHPFDVPEFAEIVTISKSPDGKHRVAFRNGIFGEPGTHHSFILVSSKRRESAVLGHNNLSPQHFPKHITQVWSKDSGWLAWHSKFNLHSQAQVYRKQGVDFVAANMPDLKQAAEAQLRKEKPDIKKIRHSGNELKAWKEPGTLTLIFRASLLLKNGQIGKVRIPMTIQFAANGKGTLKSMGATEWGK